ncbi:MULTISPECIES: Co2+/Mg2+ efflux protein ApaG [Acetobacter]|uniref:Protein ApaG n=1 Tax=Acetobacter thailandicus TaxID=1502842 RepID=A0ABT3QBE7_9PROT|nr:MULTISPECIES: Co2+/Mg2+ efflux protein ApaG [Acetobacter]MBS0959258.1 Co2+/Mg2+ efflux protein ApaG [Acetobacter thailandicus]MBS0980705.1 Co2+/Mg2+ efflux protein ApaG [Acetobacter thailandicus]MBS0984845.1 Co2+/Mg2+ efflux protein ApaG [Acetobacter thailandicus]MBS1003631.1 Co2+/Mg2+ efflux protein ApaG [Acetobacter thailandicus]MCX2562559.1 Co2+/Mg2+ efflux protein ApaG [Acetobacter thailandicus]
MSDWSASPPMSNDAGDVLSELLSSVPGYKSETEGVQVMVQVFWLPEQSEPDEDLYCWAYRIRIENTGKASVRLTERTWYITDSSGHTECIHGEGVVGEQPVLKPKADFDYTSGVSLKTAGGFMSGTYLMRDVDTGRCFDIEIPAFSLDSPFQTQQVH